MTGPQEAARRRQAVMVDLLAAIERGQIPRGRPIPSLHALSRKYGLARHSVLAALQPLVDDGVLEVRPSVGIFVRATPSRSTASAGCYVVVVHSRNDLQNNGQSQSVIHGFEDRLTSLGATSVILEPHEITAPQGVSDLPPVLGVFHFTAAALSAVLGNTAPNTGVVHYLAGVDASSLAPHPRLCFVDLDNRLGGRVATEELLWSGFHDAAFLGLHQPDGEQFPWSKRRANGWAEALRQHRPRAQPLILAPERPYNHDTYAATLAARRSVAQQAADRFGDFSACVAVDDRVAIAFAEELRHRGLPRSDWPAIVGFEGLVEASELALTSVRPRWGDLGARAASLLFDASRGRPRPAGSVHTVPLAAVPRPPRVHRS